MGVCGRLVATVCKRRSCAGRVGGGGGAPRPCLRLVSMACRRPACGGAAPLRPGPRPEAGATVGGSAGGAVGGRSRADARRSWPRLGEREPVRRCCRLSRRCLRGRLGRSERRAATRAALERPRLEPDLDRWTAARGYLL